MKTSLLILAMLGALGLSACDRDTVVNPPATPGPSGPQGEPGSSGSSTVIVTPPASAPAQ